MVSETQRLVLILAIATDGTTERIPGKDYEAGMKRYGFAAPFTKVATA